MKIIDISKNFFNNCVKKCNNKIVKNVSMCVVLMILLCYAFVANYTIGYNVMISGKNVGNVSEKVVVNTIIDEINTTYRDYFSGEDAIYEKPIFSLKIIDNNNLTKLDDVKENIIKSSPQMIKQHVITVNGIDVVGLFNNEIAQKVLDEYKNQFTINEKSFVVAFEDDVKIEEKYSPAALLMSEENAVNMLGGKYNYSYLPVLKVSVSTYETISEEIPFEVEKTIDPKMYEGSDNVSVEGKNGMKEAVVKTVKVNGETVSKDVVSENITVTPVTKVMSVGTKERPAGYGTGKFSLPYGGTITSRFGARWSRMHNGIDISGPVGSPLAAADDGVVEFAGWDGSGYGNLVKINHNNGYVTYYAHCNSVNVQKGDTVKKGDIVAALGNTGSSTGPHVHFEIRKDGAPQDPLATIN